MRRLTRWVRFVVMAGVCSFLTANPAFAQTKPASEDAQQASEDKDGCIRNLTMIYEAIQAYRAEHKDLPNWLSDLVPQYISDANVLICPVCRRTGQAETSALADPKIPSSYFFEFCPLPLGREAPGNPGRTRREWKRRQMGMVGAVVPLVRCRHHGVTLNLAFDGKIYESPGTWEVLWTNIVNPADLTPAKIFAAAPKSGDPAKPAAPSPVLRFERRDPNAKANLINLTDYYNAMLTESWHGTSQTSNDLSSLPTGLQSFAGVEFDIRGIVQLGSKSDSVARFPTQIKGIHIRQKCQRLHFLHALAFGTPADEGKTVGKYIVHFATNNNMQIDIPIVCGRDVRDWHAAEKPGAPELTMAWTGTNPVSKAANRTIHLYMTTWQNVMPDLEIQSLDYVSGTGIPAPFLIAITAD